MDLNSLDTLLFVFVNKTLHFSALASIMAVVTESAHLVMLPLLALAAVKEKTNVIKPLAVAAAAVLATDFLTHGLKEIIHRPRPCDVLDGIYLLVGCPESYAMPSGHASESFAFAVPFYFFIRSRARHALLAGAALISVSRVYAGVHYPADVIAGAAFGSAAAAALSLAYIGLAARVNRR